MFLSSNPETFMMQMGTENKESQSVQLVISGSPFHDRKTSLIHVGIKEVTLIISRQAT